MFLLKTTCHQEDGSPTIFCFSKDNADSFMMDDSSFSESETCSEGEDDNILGGISKEQRVRFR